MERKGGSTVEITAKEVQAAMSSVKTLTSEEEKALRMRFGAKVSERQEALPKAYADNAELADELLLIEMQLMKAWKMRLAQQNKTKAVAAPTRNPMKEKIVRALRKKK